MKSFQLLEHAADIGVQAWGTTLEEMFKHLLEGVYTIGLGRLPSNGDQTLTFSISGPSTELLLMRFLQEMLYLMYTKFLGVKDISLIFYDEHTLEVSGNFTTLSPEVFKLEIKSPTWHRLAVEEKDKQMICQVYFDL